MICKDIRELFSEYYDGYTPDDGSQGEISHTQIFAHLQECADCAAAYKEYAKLLDDVRAIPMPSPPPHFHEHLMQYVTTNINRTQLGGAAKRRKLPLFRSLSPIVAVAASLIFAVVWVSGVLHQQPETFTPIAQFAYEEFLPITDRVQPPENGFHAGGPLDRMLPLPGLYGENDQPIGIMPIDGYIVPMPIGIEICDLSFQPYEDEPSRRISNTALTISITVILVAAFGAAAVVLSKVKKHAI